MGQKQAKSNQVYLVVQKSCACGSHENLCCQKRRKLSERKWLSVDDLKKRRYHRRRRVVVADKESVVRNFLEEEEKQKQEEEESDQGTWESLYRKSQSLPRLSRCRRQEVFESDDDDDDDDIDVMVEKEGKKMAVAPEVSYFSGVLPAIGKPCSPVVISRKLKKVKSVPGVLAECSDNLLYERRMSMRKSFRKVANNDDLDVDDGDDDHDGDDEDGLRAFEQKLADLSLKNEESKNCKSRFLSLDILQKNSMKSGQRGSSFSGYDSGISSTSCSPSDPLMSPAPDKGCDPTARTTTTTTTEFLFPNNSVRPVKLSVERRKKRNARKKNRFVQMNETEKNILQVALAKQEEEEDVVATKRFSSAKDQTIKKREHLQKARNSISETLAKLDKILSKLTDVPDELNWFDELPSVRLPERCVSLSALKSDDLSSSSEFRLAKKKISRNGTFCGARDSSKMLLEKKRCVPINNKNAAVAAVLGRKKSGVGLSSESKKNLVVCVDSKDIGSKKDSRVFVKQQQPKKNKCDMLQRPLPPVPVDSDGEFSGNLYEEILE